MLKAVVYARVSTEDQATGEKASIPDQISWAKEEAKKRNWKFVGEYVEPGVTGDTEIENRKQLSKLIEDSSQGVFDVVMVYYSSRIAREPDIGLKFCRLLGNNHIQVLIRTHTVEINEPSNEYYWGKSQSTVLLFQMAFGQDQKENIERSDKVTSSHRHMAKQGILKNAPYGYTKRPYFKTNELGRQQYSWKFDIDPIASKVVSRIFTEYATKGVSLRQIMLQLNKENIPSPSGKVGLRAWSCRTIKNILSNPAYIGYVRHGRKLGSKYRQGKNKNGKVRRVIAKPEDWVIEKGTNFEGFINKDLYDKVADKVERRGEVKGRATASKGLLTGRVVCGKCGKKAYCKTRLIKKGKKVYERLDYSCQTTAIFGSKACDRHVMAGKKLHELVVNDINKISSNPNYKKTLLNSYTNYENKKVYDEKKIKSHVDKIEKKKGRLLTAYEEEVLTLDEYKKEKIKLDIEKEALIVQLNEVVDIEKKKKESDITRRKFKEYINKFTESFEESDLETKKLLLSSLVDSVVVTSGSVHINYRL